MHVQMIVSSDGQLCEHTWTNALHRSWFEMPWTMAWWQGLMNTCCSLFLFLCKVDVVLDSLGEIGGKREATTDSRFSSRTRIIFALAVEVFKTHSLWLFPSCVHGAKRSRFKQTLQLWETWTHSFLKIQNCSYTENSGSRNLRQIESTHRLDTNANFDFKMRTRRKSKPGRLVEVALYSL